ncbi:transposase [Neorhizobium galegae]|uniref:transposase n=1 Tax=Neorhizobium galegae TaxID=399 RepID=UPI00351D5984
MGRDAERQLGAWRGLTPWSKSSVGKESLGRIAKAGDHYLRMLLIVRRHHRLLYVLT